MEEAVEAERHWDSAFPNLRRTVGRISMYDPADLETLSTINTTREKLGLQRRQPPTSTLIASVLGSETVPESLTCVLASDDSIVDWVTCMSRARERAKAACERNGGILYESGVKTILKDDTRVTTLILENGQKISAAGAQVVLAVGPWLAGVLHASGISPPPSGRTPIATCIFAYTVRLSDEQADSFRTKPMVSHQGKGS